MPSFFRRPDLCLDRRVASVFVLLLAVAACGGDAGEPAAEGADATVPMTPLEPATTVPTVRIVSPAEGDTLDAGPVTVTLEAMGVEIAPVAEGRMDTAHHHLYLDEDLRPDGQPVPAIPNAIVHLGDGSSTFTFENVPSGEHRLIAVMADLVHVPLLPQRIDTVFFVVR